MKPRIKIEETTYGNWKWSLLGVSGEQILSSSYIFSTFNRALKNVHIAKEHFIIALNEEVKKEK